MTLKQSPEHRFEGRFDYYRCRGTELLYLTDGSTTLVVTSGTTGKVRYWSRGTNPYFGGVIGDGRDNGSIFNSSPYTLLAANIVILQGKKPEFTAEKANWSAGDDLRITARAVHTAPFRHLQRCEFHLVRGNLQEKRGKTSYDYQSDSEPHTFRAQSGCRWDDYEVLDNGVSLPRRVSSWMESRLGPKPLVLEKSVQVEAVRLLPNTTDLALIASGLTKGLKSGRWPAPPKIGTVDVAHILFRALLQTGGGLLALMTGVVGIVVWFWYRRRGRRAC